VARKRHCGINGHRRNWGEEEVLKGIRTGLDSGKGFASSIRRRGVGLEFLEWMKNKTHPAGCGNKAQGRGGYLMIEVYE
jgi:hypothetical protein